MDPFLFPKPFWISGRILGMVAEMKSNNFGSMRMKTRTNKFPNPQLACFSPTSQELFIQRCKRIVESIEEKDLWVDGKFMSEKAMTDDGMDACFC